MPIPSRTLAVLLACAAAASAGCATGVSRDTTNMYGQTFGTYPALDPGRKISEQDCTRPIVQDGANLRCK